MEKVKILTKKGIRTATIKNKQNYLFHEELGAYVKLDKKVEISTFWGKTKIPASDVKYFWKYEPKLKKYIPNYDEKTETTFGEEYEIKRKIPKKALVTVPFEVEVDLTNKYTGESKTILIKKNVAYVTARKMKLSTLKRKAKAILFKEVLPSVFSGQSEYVVNSAKIGQITARNIIKIKDKRFAGKFSKVGL